MLRAVRVVVTVLLLSILGFPCLSFAVPLQNGEADASLSTIHESDHSNGMRRHVTVVSIPYLSFMELDSNGLDAYPNFRELALYGSWAAMNVRLPYKGLESVYATWGAGQTVDARGAEAWNGSERRDGQTAAEMLERYAGQQAGQRLPSVTVPSIESIRRKLVGGSEAVPGQLGERLKQQGIRIAVWSGLDIPVSGKDHIRRPAPLMAMDEQGMVEHGTVGGGILEADGAMPFGVVTRYELVFDQWRRELERGKAGTFAVIELGDLYRLYEEKDNYAPEAFVLLKKEIIARIDRFLGDLMKEIKTYGSDGVLWVLSPQVHTEAMKEKLMLTPAVRWRANASAAGELFFSGTTQRPGIIAATDVAPSMLQEFGLTVPRSMAGMPVEASSQLESKGVKSTLEELLLDVKRKARVYMLRPPLLYGLAAFEVVAMLLGLYAVWKNGRSILLHIITRALLLSVLLLPALLLMMGWLIRRDASGVIVFVLAGMLVGGGAAALYGTTKPRLIRTFGWMGIGITLLILFDGWTGAQAMKYSVLGYDVMIGARYYGIGNEFMGVLLGAAVLGLSAMLQVRAEPDDGMPPALPRWLAIAPVVVAGVGIAGYLAAPALGTNAGGALSAAAAFGALVARLFTGGALCWRRLALAVALPMAAALAGLWLLNAAWPPGSAGGPGSVAAACVTAAAVGPGGTTTGHGSHIGRAFDALREGRYDAIGAMIARKLAMNLHLIRVSAWSKVLLTGLAVMALLVMRPKGRLRRWGERYPYLMHGFYASVIGVFAALALNDSGIVAAAAMIVYSSVPLLLLRLAEAGES
ncbi:hypothetical protein ACFQI7_24655 [Paenibacillus allorhizosphaerae]|uniref:hypothetical protein n=1 Tax=Paenibacillus allorhizosphaerae TaxID=2849866 RepID=UPI001C404BC2|nr:hypothetical protein [Paenibacillus allorhizosphaerae]